MHDSRVQQLLCVEYTMAPSRQLQEQRQQHRLLQSWQLMLTDEKLRP